MRGGVGAEGVCGHGDENEKAQEPSSSHAVNKWETQMNHQRQTP